MRYRFNEQGTFFSTRERGAQVRGEIEALLESLKPDERLILDFAGVEMTSFSFADEVVGRLLENRKAGALGDRVILLQNLDADVLDPIQRSLDRRNLIAGCLQDDEGIRLIGAPEHVAETFAAAVSHEEFRTPDLASELRISVPACNNRLKPLVEAGLLRRKGDTSGAGGRRFLYTAVVPDRASNEK